MKKHFLKCYPGYFNAIVSGNKTFEVRLNDRDFEVGDILILMEYMENSIDPIASYSGRAVARKVSYMLGHNEMPLAISPGYCVLGLSIS